MRRHEMKYKKEIERWTQKKMLFLFVAHSLDFKSVRQIAHCQVGCFFFQNLIKFLVFSLEEWRSNHIFGRFLFSFFEAFLFWLKVDAVPHKTTLLFIEETIWNTLSIWKRHEMRAKTCHEQNHTKIRRNKKL